jgi:DNA invertase Pin-like site-specific DNA recombinase
VKLILRFRKFFCKTSSCERRIFTEAFMYRIDSSLAEFEHDLLRERVRSGIAAAKARGQTFGRKQGYRPSDRHAPDVIRLSESEKLSQRQIAEKLEISKTTVNEILKRYRAEMTETAEG